MRFQIPSENCLEVKTNFIFPRLVTKTPVDATSKRVVGLLTGYEEVLVFLSDDPDFPVGKEACINDIDEWEDFPEAVGLSNT